jgi:hypothetical protein
MIVPPTSVRVLVATKPVDFRKGMDGLAALVQEELRADPFSGVIYVFRAKRADRVKLLFWDQTGLCLLSKRQVPLAGDRRWSDASVAGATLRPIGGPRLGARACPPCRASHSHAMIHMFG